ncbi:MAG: hypothetical protein WCA08_12165 [Desulfoferrobacter sp.]
MAKAKSETPAKEKNPLKTKTNQDREMYIQKLEKREISDQELAEMAALMADLPGGQELQEKINQFLEDPPRMCSTEGNGAVAASQKSLAKSTGTRNQDLARNLLDQAVSASTFYRHENEQRKILAANSTLAAMYALNPADEMEGLLVAQLLALHNQAMHYLTITALEGNWKSLEISRDLANISTKLLRAFDNTLEALQKYRKKPEQTVVVKYVHVHEGGQAIVGHIENKGGGASKNGE